MAVNADPPARTAKPAQFGLVYLLGVVTILAAAMMPPAYWGWSWRGVTGSIWVLGVGFAVIHRRVYLGLACLLVGGLLVAGNPQFGDARPAAERNACINNMKQLAMGIRSYEATHGHFPPPYIADSAGAPMHSWRVLILPYIGRQDLYDQYRFDEPWDCPNNSLLAQHMPDVYRCPSDRLPSSSVTTSYLAVTGEETMWPTDHFRTVEEVVDGVEKTVMLMECDNARVPWMSPRDIAHDAVVQFLDTGEGVGPSSNHETYSRISACVYADGHAMAYFLGESTTEHRQRAAFLKAVLTVDGGESLEDLY